MNSPTLNPLKPSWWMCHARKTQKEHLRLRPNRSALSRCSWIHKKAWRKRYCYRWGSDSGMATRQRGCFSHLCKMPRHKTSIQGMNTSYSQLQWREALRRIWERQPRVHTYQLPVFGLRTWKADTAFMGVKQPVSRRYLIQKECNAAMV